MNLKLVRYATLAFLVVQLSASAAAQDIQPDAALGTSFTYQGRLSDGGSPANGSYDFLFKLYNASLGGSQVGPNVTSNDLPVSDGYFTVLLDFGTGAFNGQARWLEISVRPGASSDAYIILSPRQALTAAPYALYSRAAPWTGLTGVPAGFADGVDNNTTYSPGFGLTLNGSQFSVNTTSIQHRITESCAAGNSIRVIYADGSVDCEADTDTTSFWSLTGNSGTNPTSSYLGTSDNQALEVRVNGLRALRLEPNVNGPNLIGGYSGNWIVDGVYGVTLFGGAELAGISYPNRVTDLYGTVSGGLINQAGDDAGTVNDAAYATVGGGVFNIASGIEATVGGGWDNTASGIDATVGGGRGNIASGVAATVGGGFDNTANEYYAAVGGGLNNQALATNSTIGGGGDNIASGWGATVSGGYTNTASLPYATISGGYGNTANADYAAVGGGQENVACGAHATVSGGYSNLAGFSFATTISGGYGNTANADYAAVGGGLGNQALAANSTIGGGTGNSTLFTSATIGGGEGNIVGVNGASGTIGGGWMNFVNGNTATVPGGAENEATAGYSFAAGAQAHATHSGSFVWSSDEHTYSYADSTFTVRAHGGARFYTASGTSVGVVLASGGGAWSNLSDRKAKENFQTIDGQVVLGQLAQLPITSWNYISQDDAIRHLGPTAQDFSRLFNLGEDDTHITTVDADGVALVAIQGLYSLSQEQSAQITELTAENVVLKAQLNDIESRLASLERGGGAQTTQSSIWSVLPSFGLVVLGFGGVFAWRRKAGVL